MRSGSSPGGDGKSWMRYIHKTTGYVMAESDMRKPGMVYIIGAGPGDPGLMTMRGTECLGEADVVVYDYLVSTEILRLSGKDARLIYVGKIGGQHSITQENLNRVLVEEAVKGQTVARLKGGDPFVFGRGGEEAEFLREAGVSFEVVPGITSAIAVPAYAGIPLTHRALTSTVAFVTGHEDPTKGGSSIDWKGISTVGTLVFLMGVRNLPRITDALMNEGKDPATPVALIRWGTTPDQETLTGTLADIAARAEEHSFSPPAICVVGEVVGLRDRLAKNLRPFCAKGGRGSSSVRRSRSPHRKTSVTWIAPSNRSNSTTGSSSPARTGSGPSSIDLIP